MPIYPDQPQYVRIHCFFTKDIEIMCLRRCVPRMGRSNIEDHLEMKGYKPPPITRDEYNLLIKRLLVDPPYPLTPNQRDALLTKILENTEVHHWERKCTTL